MEHYYQFPKISQKKIHYKRHIDVQLPIHVHVYERSHIGHLQLTIMI